MQPFFASIVQIWQNRFYLHEFIFLCGILEVIVSRKFYYLWLQSKIGKVNKENLVIACMPCC
jgi:hypothetical protein